DSMYYLHSDAIIDPLPLESGHLQDPDGPGLGVEGDEDKLTHYRDLNAEEGDHTGRACPHLTRKVCTPAPRSSTQSPTPTRRSRPAPTARGSSAAICCSPPGSDRRILPPGLWPRASANRHGKCCGTSRLSSPSMARTSTTR